MELAGRSVLVTGGSRGIGAAIALRLAREGADVAITFRNAADEARTTVAGIESFGGRARAIHADSADAQALIRAVDDTAAEFGRLDILVNNAGIFPFGPPDSVTVEEIDHTLAVHVRALFVAAQAALRHMVEGGRIISIGSCLGRRVPVAGVTLYAMSKSALIGLTKGLARDLGEQGITVNLVDPGPVDTDMNPAASPEAEAERNHTALRRYGTVDEIAAAVAFLARDEARFVTGASIAVDGGYAA